MKAFLTRALVFAFPCVAVAQIAILQIKVLEGEGAAHPAGAHISRPLIVLVTDDMGQPVAGAAVSFQLPPEGPSGLFSNGLRTDLAITHASGHASIHSIQLNRTPGQFRIRITAVTEQARAGIVAFQNISDAEAAAIAPPVAAPVATVTPAPTPRQEPPAKTAPAAVPEPSAERSAGPPMPEARSAGITPTTVKMGSGISKKWILVAVIAVAGAAAVLGVSRIVGAKGSSPSTPSTAATIGTPTITIGNPNP